MEIVEYKIKKGDTLESISKEYNISIDELVDFHNKNCGITSLIVNDKLPIQLMNVIIDKNQIKQKNIENANKDIIVFDKKLRYRCEQFNTTKLEDRITFHCNTKKEYTLEQNEHVAKVLLKDYLYKINPENLSLALEATKELEFYKENALFEITENNEIKNVLNFSHINKMWREFIPKLKNSKYFNEIEKINTNAAEDIINGGNVEFGNEENLIKTFNKTLFYHVIFNNKYKQIDKKNEKFNFLSQIFVNIPIELELQNSIVKEDEDFIEYRTVGSLLRDKIDNNVLEDQYNNFYRPIIEYGFSEYNYEYRVRRLLNKKTNVVVNASVMMKEEVKNNYQLITQFDLKQIEY